ncbi:MAG: ribonuclease D [Atopobiaceae bacterium]|nr:ribonuclease D [Atopobiaceae bacterium]
MFISDSTTLASFCERAADAKVLAVDTEFLRERTFYPKLCLIQLSTEAEIAAVDPLAIEDLAPLEALLGDDSITKVFHACSQDLEVIGGTLGVFPHPVFDTQLAAAFLGRRMQLGYGPLVEAYTGVHLPKAESLTDWSRRPLDEKQLEYAEDDVRYLPGIYRDMMRELVARDRLSWLEPELACLVDPARYRHEPSRAFEHLKRSSSLTRKQLAIAREVCAWRETKAANRDIPRKWVLSDEVIVEVCRRAPGTVERLRRIRGTEQISQRDCESIARAVAKGASCPPDALPRMEHHAKPSPEVESVMDLMYAMLRLVSDESGVAIQLIATRDDLHDFIVDRKASRLSSGWRHDLLGSKLENLLSGSVGLTVKDGRVEIL